MTNALFIGAYAEFAIASASGIAAKPKRLSFAEAASVPVIATTAYQMLFEHAQLRAGQTALILGATGNVGAFATQLASSHGATVIGATASRNHERALQLGASQVIETRDGALRHGSGKVDVVIDTVGGDLQRDALAMLKPGGIFVSAVARARPFVARGSGRSRRLLLCGCQDRRPGAPGSCPGPGRIEDPGGGSTASAPGAGRAPDARRTAAEAERKDRPRGLSTQMKPPLSKRISAIRGTLRILALAVVAALLFLFVLIAQAGAAGG